MNNSRDQIANAVNTSAPVNGTCMWMCNVCGTTWEQPQEAGYDRMSDKQRCPVLCVECTSDLFKKALGVK